MYWEGHAAVSPGRAAVRAASQRLRRACSATARFIWSGDVYSTWETLEDARPDRDQHRSLRHAVLGHGHRRLRSDGGVHRRAATCAGSSSARSVRRSASHGRNWHLRLPWGWNVGDVRPSEVRGYTGGASDPAPSRCTNAAASSRSVRKYLELRYRLLPYLYTIVRECTTPACRSCARSGCTTPTIPQAVARGDEFLWGRDILVVARGREGRDLAAAVSAARDVVRLLDGGDGWTAGARSIAPVDLADDAALRPRRRHHADGAGPPVHRRSRSTSR